MTGNAFLQILAGKCHQLQTFWHLVKIFLLLLFALARVASLALASNYKQLIFAKLFFIACFQYTPSFIDLFFFFYLLLLFIKSHMSYYFNFSIPPELVVLQILFFLGNTSFSNNLFFTFFLLFNTTQLLLLLPYIYYYYYFSLHNNLFSYLLSFFFISSFDRKYFGCCSYVELKSFKHVRRAHTTRLKWK